MFAGVGRVGLVVDLMNRERGFGEGGADRGRGGEISRVSAPWRGRGFVVDLVGGAGESVMVVGVPFLICDSTHISSTAST